MSQMKKRIGIITIQKCDNYGADLQAFALQRVLLNEGYDAENIDYLFYKNQAFRSTRASRPLFHVAFLNRVKEFAYPRIARIRGFLRRAACRKRAERFAAFFEKMRLSRCYRSLNDLFAAPPDYDVYLVGSDQVWNPRINTSLRPYFLEFAPEGKRCAAYASSFGVSELPAFAVERYRQGLSRFSCIGVREQSGVEIVENQLGLQAEQVLDPTLLLEAEAWEKVAVAPCERGRYLLVYDLLPCEPLWVLARRWAYEKNVKIIRLSRGCSLEKRQGVVNCETAGPGEFIGLFQNAEAVVTNSFHGTIFAIIFKKSFYAVIPDRMTNAGRISDLLTRLALEDRLVAEAQCGHFSPVADIDFDAKKQRLEDERVKAMRMLMRCVNG